MSAPTSQHEALLSKWQEWLRTITDDIVTMHGDRLVWRDLMTILESNPAIPQPLWIRNWITQQYVSTMAMAVRRQAEPSDDVVSLGGLLTALMRNPAAISRGWCRTHYGPNDEYAQAVANANFDRWAPSGGDSLEAAVLCDELAALREMTNNVTRFATTRIAHHDRVEPAPFTFGDLDAAVDHLGELLREMHVLLTGVGLLQVEPVIVFNWRCAFAVPWLSPEEVERWQEIRREIGEGDRGKS